MIQPGLDTITLGDFIGDIEKWIAHNEQELGGREKAEGSSVTFDFAGATPTVLNSWRGVYLSLALGYSAAGESGMNVGELLDELKSAVGKTYQGWKGGDYVMDRDTEVWVDNTGIVTHTMITGINMGKYSSVILTRNEYDRRERRTRDLPASE